MSIRPLALSARAAARSTPLLPSPSVTVAGIRPLSSSSSRRAGHGGHEQGHDDHSHGDSSADTHETFFSPAMRATLLLTALFTISYPYLPSPSRGSASPSASPTSFSTVADKADTPLITRLLAKYTPEAKTWTERNDKHLELTKDRAEERLLFQEAERPKVWRMRYAAAFEQASPNCIPVGSQTDLSDLQVKRE